MTTRRRKHHLVLLLIVVVIGLAVLHWLAAVAVLGTIPLIGWWIWSHREPRRPPLPVAPGVLAELDRAHAEIADLNARLDAANASAMAAWDASASRPPRRSLGDTAPLCVLDAEQLAEQPMSGVRRIGGYR
jgi:hypothetical protein